MTDADRLTPRAETGARDEGREDALLARAVRESGFRFTTVTPATHARVNARPESAMACSLQDMLADRLGETVIRFAAGESIRTETSHKYPPEAFRALAVAQGWEPIQLWIDADSGFSLHLFRT